MLASLAANKVDLGASRSGSTGASLPQPMELVFELDDKCTTYINRACKHFDELVSQHDLEVS
jgi:carnitine O-acetyltransferase